jgi:tetratricopeptide (TPR) repeat protein
MRARWVVLPVTGVAVAALAACSGVARLPAKAIELNRTGAEALAEGDLELAEARVALALEYNQAFTEAWVNLGLVEMKRGNLERARSAFTKARALNPDLAAPHHALGLLSEQEGHPDEAERRYRSALKVDPGFVPARVNLGRLLFERGAFDEAREQFLRLTQVAPDVLEGWTSLCEALLKLGRSDEVEQVTNHARLRFGPMPELDLARGRALMQRGAFTEAAALLRPLSLHGDPGLAARASAWLAVARLGAGDGFGARAAAAAAIALDARDPVALYALRETSKQAR